MGNMKEVLEMPDRDTTIKTIKTALQQRSGKAWSVTGGRGTAWGWIAIMSPPRRRTEYDTMTTEDQEDLGKLLGLPGPVHKQGAMIPASGAYYQEYIARAKGETPTVHGTPYWD